MSVIFIAQLQGGTRSKGPAQLVWQISNKQQYIYQGAEQRQLKTSQQKLTAFFSRSLDTKDWMRVLMVSSRASISK